MRSGRLAKRLAKLLTGALALMYRTGFGRGCSFVFMPRLGLVVDCSPGRVGLPSGCSRIRLAG